MRVAWCWWLGAGLAVLAVSLSDPPVTTWAQDGEENDALRLYVANSGSKSVSVIDHPSRMPSVLASISVATGPSAVLADPENGELYVTVPRQNLLETPRIHNEGMSVSVARPNPIAVGRWPLGVALVNTSQGKRVYVTNFDDNTVSVIDPAPRRVIANVRVGRGPSGIAVARTRSGRSCVYLANLLENTVSVIDAESHLVLVQDGKALRIPVGRGPMGVAVDPAGVAGATVYVTNTQDDTVSVIEVEKNRERTGDRHRPLRIRVGGSPGPIAVSPDGRLIVAASLLDHRLWFIEKDGDRAEPVPTAGRANGLSFSSDSRYLYVSDPDKDVITTVAVEGRTSTGVISVGAVPAGVAVRPVGPFYVATDGSDRILLRELLYVANGGGNTVTVISGAPASIHPVTQVAVGRQPMGVAVSHTDGLRAYVTNAADNTVSVIDERNRVVRTIRVGRRPTGVAANPKKPFVYVANANTYAIGEGTQQVQQPFGLGTISVIDTTRNEVIAEIRVGRRPEGVTVSADGESVYVLSVADSLLSSIHTSDGGVAHLRLQDSNRAGLWPTVSVVPGTVPASAEPADYIPSVVLAFHDTLAVFRARNQLYTVDLKSMGMKPQISRTGKQFWKGIAALPGATSSQRAFATYKVGAGQEIAGIDVTDDRDTFAAPVGANPVAAAMSPTTGRWIYVTNADDQTVSVIDRSRNRVVTTFHVGRKPLGLAAAELPPSPP